MLLKYFSEDELKCKGSGGIRLSPFLFYQCDVNGIDNYVDALRHEFGFPIHLNSACRSAKYNEEIKGHKQSLHVYDKPYHNTGGCMAFDVNTKKMDGQQKYKFLSLAIKNGWSVGIANDFIHIDRRAAIGLPLAMYTY